jgi:pimeloyl-ACP methyl ester carboxylesterase
MAAPRPYGGSRSGWTDVGGLTMHARTGGSGPGPRVVLVHGLAVLHRYLMPTAALLGRRHPVGVPDLPGFGLSAEPGRVLGTRDWPMRWLAGRDRRRTGRAARDPRRPSSTAAAVPIDRRGSSTAAVGQPPQPQAPPQHPPARGAAAAAPGVPVSATVDSSLTVSACPCGHGAGCPASAIGRDSSKVLAQFRHRYS